MANSTPFTLREAEPRDVADIVELIRELAAFERLTHLLQVTPERLAPQLFGPAPAAQALVAQFEGRTVGFALYFSTFSTFLAQPGLWLEDLYVKPAQRGQGIGTALLARLAALALERGCGRLEWSVLDWNERAIRVYKGIGATVMADWRICRVAGEGLHALAANAR